MGFEDDIDVADLIDDFATGVYAVTRRTAGTFQRGAPVAGASSSLSITASVQPASGQDLQRLPEGRRALETRVVYTTTPLLVGGQGANNTADQVVIDGDNWEVQQAQTWPAGGLYCRAIVQRAQPVRS